MEYTVLEHQDILSVLPDRKPDAHKGNFGKILLLCGSRGYTGAAYFAAMGALRCGAGLVFLGVPETIYHIEAVKLNEPIVLSLADDQGKLSKTAATEILDRIAAMDAVLLGPGLGQSEGTSNIVRQVLENADCPVVLDADGINLIGSHKHVLRERTAPTILTPHMGEFSRLGGNAAIDRITSAVEMARDLGCIMVLKGHKTVITDGQAIYINPTGNPGMAKGGSGDVLAGLTAGLAAQMPQKPLEAAVLAVWLHSRAGALARQAQGTYAMLPRDVLNCLGKAFLELEQE